jgi:hypothetical protein
MLRGRFGDTTGRPYLEGRLILPRLGVRGDISFIVDTGADRSLLMPLDGIRMGINYAGLTGNVESIGIGGVTHNFEEEAIVIFADPRNIYIYLIDLEIAAPTSEIERIPTLLGRDILDQWRMVYHPARNRLSFTVISADYTAPLARGTPA